MSVVHEYNVVPFLPPKLSVLNELAHNLHWTWDHDLIDVFRRLDYDLWEKCGHNPILLLSNLSQSRLEAISRDEAYMTFLETVNEAHQEYMQDTTWYEQHAGEHRDVQVAYFSAEFGLTECLPLYSGGLGILSGDHLKSSSELGIPLIGVGLLYRKGYFVQYLNADGWQQAIYPDNDFYNMPVRVERHLDGQPLYIEVPLADRCIRAQIWRIQIGRIPLILLDTNIASNSQEDRAITGQLYGGDRDMRIRQEILLGIGGFKALQALGIRPTVCHMNEGHSAFLILERIRHTMHEYQLDYASASELCRAGNAFTTHTPVPAGFDLFSKESIEQYLEPYLKQLNLSVPELMQLGRNDPENEEEAFNMAVFAIRNANHINGVSRLHAEVSRQLFRSCLPKIPQHEIAVSHITNGVHARSWLSRDMVVLLNRYLGQRWLEDPADYSRWQRMDRIPNEELWRTHERRRERLVALARTKMHDQLLRRGASKAVTDLADEILDPTALTIGFARRFATYKRATLLLTDLERLRTIVNDVDRPVQFIFAGKAHPNDDAGKEFIREIVRIGRQEEFRRRIVFLEQYDISLARYLVQGVDLWLNTPRRPFEASGTSGMKVVFNGGLNLSILDGWWCEGYQNGLGWAIGNGEEYEDYSYQDRVESDALYDILEKAIIPVFYNRGHDGLPREWIAMMKASMRELGQNFCTNRMVYEYTEKVYHPAHAQYVEMEQNQAKRAQALAQYKRHVRLHWDKIKILDVQFEQSNDVKIGDEIRVTAVIQLSELTSDQIAVQIYDSHLAGELYLKQGSSFPMTLKQRVENQNYLYEGFIRCMHSGKRGFTIRVLPQHTDLRTPQMMALIQWEGE